VRPMPEGVNYCSSSPDLVHEVVESPAVFVAAYHNQCSPVNIPGSIVAVVGCMLSESGCFREACLEHAHVRSTDASRK
jgi:hypothetical protein